MILNEISLTLENIGSDNGSIETDMVDIPCIRICVSQDRHNAISADRLSDILCIGSDRTK